MKRKIMGTVYNTDESTKLAHYNNGLPNNDLQWQDCDLYVTPDGAYFLAGDGGANTWFAHRDRDMYCSGENIVPFFTAAEAIEWAYTVLSCEDCKRIFGDRKPEWAD